MLTGCLPRGASPQAPSMRSMSASSSSTRQSSPPSSTSSSRGENRSFRPSAHRYKFRTWPESNPTSIITSENARYRITVLTDGLLRLEWSGNGIFEDRASTFAINRSFAVPDFQHKDCGDKGLEISTKRFRLSYDKKKFSTSGLSVQVLGSMTDYDSIWRFGNPVKDLGGTIRTLDEIDGRTTLGPSVISRNGFGLIDDSTSMLFTNEGWVMPRHQGQRTDIYVFAYGHDYRAAVQAFYHLSGHQPLLPRWALGNWWSRFYAYSDKEYLNLMDEFKQRDIPLSVAVIDMDWHIVRDPRCQAAGVSGWTSYTFNRNLFPDPLGFGNSLHDRGLKFTLNDHPADGVHSFEDQYELMSDTLCHDRSTKDPIPFDITDRNFCDAFYDVLHRDVEEISGCDFWWTDWQQGSHSQIPGIDPLWMLNHFGFQDNRLNPSSSQPLTFSRYAGPGSHRYPVGFSGDSVVSWASLEFQPELTSCASNIGYGWWSHDIGGHMQGKKDDELATRWVQYGVFSPIMRLHSTANPWNSKEPWNCDTEACAIQTAFLQQRHKLLPYLQAMNIRASLGEPLCQPMYWDYPDKNEAYEVPNQYMFGSSLLVAPITSQRDPTTGLARTRAWFPPGKFVDFFTGRVYDGNRQLWLHRTLDAYPVFAPAGAIIPLDGSKKPQNGCPVPSDIELMVVVGKDGSFALDESERGTVSKTMITFHQASGVLRIKREHHATTAPPRRWTIHFPACAPGPVAINGLPCPSTSAVLDASGFGFKLDLGTLDPSSTDEIVVVVGEAPQLAIQSPLPACKEILHRARVEYDLKQRVWEVLTMDESRVGMIGRLHAVDMEERLHGALMEVLTATS